MARFRLRTFGGLTLESADTGTSVPTGRRPLGLLAVLATAGARGLSREKITALLWPERDTERGRNSLSQVLSALRRDLGAEDLVVGTSEIRLNPNVIASDVAEFEQSLDGNPEGAAALYVGPFLDGFFLSDAPEFERWVDDRRSHLHAQQRSVLQHLAEDATRRNDCTLAVSWWRRLAAHDPASARAAIGLMEALAASGDRAAALQHFREYRRGLEHELGAEPEASVVAVAERLRRGEGDVTPVVGPRSLGVATVAEPPHALTLGAEGSPIDRQLDPVASMRIEARPYLSRRRSATNGFFALAAVVSVVGVIMWLRAAGVRPFGSLLTAGTLDANARLLVADFKTTGPDTALSSPLAEAMRMSLGQSRIISIVPISRSTAALWLMKRAPDSRLDLPLAREIAQREGVKAVVAGTLTPLNDGSYLLSTRLVMASSGDELAAYQETVGGAILPAIDRLARKLRQRIGESMKLVRADPPLEHVTTGSLDALKRYTAALQVNARGDPARAITLLQDAIRIDSTFAMAYRQLITSMGNSTIARTGLGEFTELPEASLRARAKLYALRDRLPERERLEALAAYYAVNVGDRNKALAVSDTLLNEFPNTPGALNVIASYWMNLREFARAESMFARVIANEPTTPVAYFNIVQAQIARGKYDAAWVSLDRARRKVPSLAHSPVVADILYNLGRRDSAEAIAKAQVTSIYALDRLNGHNTLSVLAALHGQIAEARTHLADARTIERERGYRSIALADSLIAAQIQIVFFKHNPAAARTLDRALAETPLESIWWIPSRPYLPVASLYAQANRADQAKAMLAAYDRAVSDTAQRRRDRPGHDSALAYVALAEQRPRDAVAAFRRSDFRADGGHGDQCAVCIDPGIGLAFDRAGMTDSAIVALEHFVNAPSLRRKVVDAWNLHWVLRRLGELHEARGDTADAVKYYRMFAELWNHADPELQPTVAEVKQRLARLSKN